ncbi:MAG: hypothetical protein EZS28_024576 [Streblomastix strix]|uniref:Uncharacterized protein n=1 Tax=Streblomastix strix TaxID=222440 RepID=A0A5J4VBI2_9EUKA|nr:MAG: hypothetical protein EZS28_024576 [Streblomastix strix]
MTALSAQQSTPLTANAKALEGNPNADKCKHILKLSAIGAYAMTYLWEGFYLPYQFKVIVRNNVQPPEIITEDTMLIIKRYTEQKNLGYQASAISTQYWGAFLQQLFNPNPVQYLAPPYLYNQVEQYYKQQPGGFLRRMKEFQGILLGGRGRGPGGFLTNVQTGANAFAVYSRNP